MSSQFLRVEAFSRVIATSILAEASREPDYCRHVRQMPNANWIMGSQLEVSSAIETYMAQPVPIQYPNGKLALRKQRRDHRCLVAGVASWPEPVDIVRKGMQRARAVRDWIQGTLHWLDRKFGERFVAAVLHLDESHPHIHFFVVGDANKTHPGLRARYENGVRIESKKEKDRRYRNALTQFLDDYHLNVCADFGMVRKTRLGSICRIKDRGLANRVLQLEARLVAENDEEGLERLGEIVRDAPKVPRTRMMF